MIKGTVSLKNFEGFDGQLAEVVRAVEENLSEVADIVHREAKASAGFADKTGNLRKSIRKKKSKFKNGGFIVSASGHGGDKGYHAALVEFGHVKFLWGKPTGERVPPHPFMRPALEIGLQKALELFRSKQ